MFEQRRADPTLGVLETMLVLDGEPVELGAHLGRLRHSVEQLYGQGVPPSVADDLRAKSHGVEQGKARITAAPSGIGVECEALAGEFLAHAPRNSPTAVSLHSLTVPGGLGAHKWADRSLVDEAAAELSAGGLSLIVDRDGAPLEASRANLFAVRDGALFTPPLDGRILPGVTRARVVALAAAAGIEVHEVELTRSDLHEVDEAFLTGSVRGVEPVATLDGEVLGRNDQISAQLATELQQTWRGSRSPVG